MFFKSNLEKAKERKIEEHFFNIVAQELEQNIKHNSTWVKAIAKSQGNIEKAKSYYIDFRMQSLKDDAILQQDTNNQKEAEQRLSEAKFKEENRYKKQKEREEQIKKANSAKLNPLIMFIMFSIIIIILFKFLVAVK